MKIKKIIIILLIVCMSWGLLVVFQLYSGRFTPDLAKKIRIRRLMELKSLVEIELKNSADYDKCLYRIFERRGAAPDIFFVPNAMQTHVLPENPDEFNESIGYGLFHQQEKWYLIEKKADLIFTDLLMIDDTGNIYVIQKEQDNSQSNPPIPTQ